MVNYLVLCIAYAIFFSPQRYMFFFESANFSAFLLQHHLQNACCNGSHYTYYVHNSTCHRGFLNR